MSSLRTPAGYSRTGNGAKPKSRICRLTSSRSQIPFLVVNTTERSLEVTESLSSSPSRSSTSPQRVSNDRRSSRKHSEERQQTYHSPKRSPRRYLPFFNDDSFQGQMGLGLRVSSTTSTCVDQGPGMSFLEFETLYTLKKEMLMQSRCSQDISVQLGDKYTAAGWFGDKRSIYMDLPDPLLCHRTCTCGATPPVSQTPSEGFSFAPGWSLNADHFYQW